MVELLALSGLRPATSVAAVSTIVDVPSVPIEAPVLVFAIAMAVFLLGPLLVRRLGQPGIVGIIVLGALLGPGGTGLVDHVDAIVLLGEVGLVYLLFTIGLDLDFRGLKASPEDATFFGLASFGIPFVVGIVVGTNLLGLDVWAAALLSAVFSSHTLLAYPIINQYGITKNDAITAVFGGILFTDTLALIVLAIAVGAVDAGLSVGLLGSIGLSLVILFASVWLLAPPIARWFFQNFSEESYFEFLFVMVVLFAAAGLAEVVDISPILGAFVAGLALNRLIPDGGPLRNRIEFVGNAFFIPFFLVHVGMLVDLGVLLDGATTLVVAAVILVTMVAMKAVAAGVVGFLQGYSRPEIGTIYGLSIGQAAAALAITLVGYDAGMFDETILNAVVLMLLVSAVVSPLVTKRYSEQLALAAEIEDGDGAIEDPTVLLPLSHYADLQRRLLEFSFLFKPDDTDEPVHVLSVVRPERDDDATEETVSKVRADLETLRDVGDEAEILVDTETRVSRNIASGIVRGSVEVEADMILMGWDATPPSLSQRVFGSIIDRVLDRTRLPVLIARLGHPANTTERVHVVLPNNVDHHEGFFEALHLTKKATDRVGAEITLLPVEGPGHQYERLYDLVEPSIEADIEPIDTWDGLDRHLDAVAEADDLVVVLSPRRGDIGWTEELTPLASKLATLPAESFLIIHPRKGDPQYDRRFLRFQ